MVCATVRGSINLGNAWCVQLSEGGRGGGGGSINLGNAWCVQLSEEGGGGGGGVVST